MFSTDPMNPQVVVDGNTGRPRELRAGGERHPVTALEAVRDETAAYSVGSGPRTVFVVRAMGRRYRLVHLLRDRRWLVEELGNGASPFASAA